MQSKFLTKALSVVLALAMVVGLFSGSFVSKSNAAERESGKNVTYTKTANLGNGRYFADKHKAQAFEEAYVQEGNIRVSIVLESQSTLDKGFSTKNIASNQTALNYRAQLRAEQEAVTAKIEKNVLGGEKLDVVWNITLAGNIISANVPYDKLDNIRMIRGVKDVVVETMYEPEKAEVALEPQMATASGIVHSSSVWELGYTGLGSRIAVVDTGLDTDHELFDPEAFEYALEQADKDVDLLTAAEIAEVIDELNLRNKIPNASADLLYVNSKVPFGANYVDNDLDITHDNDGQGEHGSHVAGIAAGNRFVTDDKGGFMSSIEKVETQGQAPDAQLLIMKVFGKNGGAYDSDYLVAIEDAIILNCDSVNLSLGSAMAGFATSSTYQKILDSFADSDTVVVISAGNAYKWAEKATGDLYADDVNFSTLGSPGSFANAFTVASVDNGGYGYLVFPDYPSMYLFYTETSGYGNEPFSTLVGTQEYVYLDSVGTDEEFAAIADAVEGKIAICNRGETSFYQKVNAAADAGAIGVIIVNNQSGVINMNLTGITTNIPAVSVTQEFGLYIKYYFGDAVYGESGNKPLYYEGSIDVCTSGEGEHMMSDFSSWGVPGDLSLKPEITAPGGSVLSVNGAVPGGKAYEVMSGTSMAAPQIAGLSALVGQYIRENGLEQKTGMTARQLITSLLMSTARPLQEPGYEVYSVMKQGAGLADVYSAITAKSFLTVDSVVETAPASAAESIADGKVKVELGAMEEDSFDVLFSIHNFSDEDVAYNLSAKFFSQYESARSDTTYSDTQTVYVDCLWTVDGEPLDVLDSYMYDFNGDGMVNIKDAQFVLRALVDESIVTDEYFYYFADFDEDGDVDSYDAYLAFDILSTAALVVPAGQTVQIMLTVSGLEDAYG